MNAISDKFSVKRMWTVAGHYCVANARNILIRAAVMFGIIFLITLLITKMSSEEPEFRGAMVGVFFMMAAGLIFSVTGSLTFSSYSTKPMRIAAMMLPATKAEKFVAMSLIYVVFGNILILLTLLLSDSLTASLFGMNSAVSYLPDAFSDADPEFKKFIPLLVMGILWFFLFDQAIYVVGSTLWPKLSFLKTFIAVNVFQTVLTIFIPFYHIGDWFSNHFDLIQYFDTPEKAFSVACWVIVVAYLILPAVYAIAWLRFRNLAVAKRFLS